MRPRFGLVTLMVGATVVAVSGFSLSRAAAATALPDLSVVRSGPAQVGLGAAYTDTLTVTNQGTAAAAGVVVTYTPGTPSVSSLTAGVACAPLMRGHSGRGGGYTRVGWTCAAGGLAAGAHEQVQLSVLAPRSGVLSEGYAVAPSTGGAQLNVVSHSASAAVSVIIPPAPAAPTKVGATQSGDNLIVGWTPDPATAAYLTSSLITATPAGGTSPVLTAVAGGAATSGVVTALQPLTTYSVTVTSRDAGGTSPASAAIAVTTPASTVPPGAPTIQYHWWASSYLAASWAPGSTGDSPIDQYQVNATNYDGDTPVVVTAYVTTTSAYMTVDQTLDWTVTVRAHNAAGWGPWSAPVVQGGL